MGQGTGTVNCKLGDEPLKIVETKDGMDGNWRDSQYQMVDWARLVRTGEIDAVDEEDENLDEDEDLDDEDFEDEDEDLDDDDEFEDDDDEDDEDEDDDDETPTAGAGGQLTDLLDGASRK
jgi:hypothetical protein